MYGCKLTVERDIVHVCPPLLSLLHVSVFTSPSPSPGLANGRAWWDKAFLFHASSAKEL